MAPTEVHDPLCVVDATGHLPVRNPVQSRQREPGPVSDDLHAPDRIGVPEKSHGSECSRFRDSRQPFSRPSNVIPFMGYNSRRGEAVSQSVSEAMFAALFALVEREGWPYVKRLGEISKSTAGRWAQEFRAGEAPGFNRESFDGLMKLEEVRSAVAAAAANEAETDAAK